MVVLCFKQCVYFCSIFQNISTFCKIHLLLHSVMVGMISRWKYFLWNPLFFHTFSFSAHWSSSLSLFVFIAILAIPYECMSPRTLFYLPSHFLLWGLIFHMFVFHVPCFLSQVLDLTMFFNKNKSNTSTNRNLTMIMK